MAETLVVSPSITGNIGSCAVQQIDSPKDIGLWSETHQITLTNSCTGEVQEQYTYSMPGSIWEPVIILLFMAIVSTGVIAMVKLLINY